MVRYRLVTLLGYLLIIGAILSFCGYLTLLISVSNYMGDGLIYKIMVGCLIGAVCLLQFRSVIVASAAARLIRCGERLSARVLASQIVGERDMDEQGQGDWYRLIVRLCPVAGVHGERDMYVEQLLNKQAADWIRPGQIIPIRYSRSMGLAMIDHADAYPSLRGGRQFWPSSVLINFTLRRQGISRAD